MEQVAILQTPPPYLEGDGLDEDTYDGITLPGSSRIPTVNPDNTITGTHPRLVARPGPSAFDRTRELPPPIRGKPAPPPMRFVGKPPRADVSVSDDDVTIRLSLYGAMKYES